MRKRLRYRLIGNGNYEYHSLSDFGGEYIGLKDASHQRIYEGDEVSGYDEMLKERIEGVVVYIAPSFCIRTGDGYHQSLDNIKELLKL